VSRPIRCPSVDGERAAEAFESLYRRTYKKTLAYVIRRTAEPADAHDVVAETYLIAWRRLDEFSKARSPQAWLYRVARLTLANHRRSSKRLSSLVGKIETQKHTPQSPPDPAQAAESRDELRRMVSAMHSLSERDREILCLAAFEDLDHGDIALVLDIRKALVRSVLHRARKRLATALDVDEARHEGPSGHKHDAGESRANRGDGRHG